MRTFTYPYYGVHSYPPLAKGTQITAVSAATWEEYYALIRRDLHKDDRVAVSPELITVAGVPFSNLKQWKNKVAQRIKQIKEYSKLQPQTLFVLGTPTFPLVGRPNNSALFIKNGAILGQTNKRSGAAEEERNTFNLRPEEPAMLLPGTKTGLLICADLSTLSVLGLTNTDQILRLSGRQNLIGKEVSFVHPNATSLVVISCWGVGGNRQLMAGRDANVYYQLNLRGVITRVFHMHPRLECIAVVDRCPQYKHHNPNLHPTEPFNTVFYRT